MSHRIDRIRFEIEFSKKEAATDLQDEIFRICRHDLSRRLDALLEGYGATFQLDQIELDLGELVRSDLDQKLLKTLIEKLEVALKAYLSDEYKGLTSDQSQLEILVVFLEKGLKHWKQNKHFSVRDLFLEVLDHSARSLFRVFLSSKYKPEIVSRILEFLIHDDFVKLVTKMRPAEVSFIMSFIANVNEINTLKPFSTATTGEELDLELKQLVLLDLITDYGSAFNRKAFIERNLQGIATHFGLSYLQLLEHFEQILKEEMPFRMANTLPAIIRNLSQAYHQEEPELTSIPIDYQEVFKTLIDVSGDLHDELKENFEQVLRDYEGELQMFLLRQTRTRDQVRAVVKKLSVVRLDTLIQVIEPEEYRYIQIYIKGARKVHPPSATLITDQKLQQTIYEVVLTYLLVDRGTRFNQKAFLRYQLVGLGRTMGVGYLDMLGLLRESLEKIGVSNLGARMLHFLKEFLVDEEERLKSLEPGTLPEGSVFDSLRGFLKSGTIRLPPGSQGRERIQELFENALIDGKIRSDLFHLITQESSQIADRIIDFDRPEFVWLLRMILIEKWDLTRDKQDKILHRINVLERQSVYPVGFQKSVFHILLNLSIKPKDVSKLMKDSGILNGNPDVLMRHIQSSLTLDEIQSEVEYSNTLYQTKKNGQSTFTEARKRLQQFLQWNSKAIEPHHWPLIRNSFAKIMESRTETFLFLDRLDEDQLIFLFTPLEKGQLSRLVELLTDGKWGVLQVPLKTILKGSAKKDQAITTLFAHLTYIRNANLSEVYEWLIREFGHLTLPESYREQVLQELLEVKVTIGKEVTDGAISRFDLEVLDQLKVVMIDQGEESVDYDLLNDIFEKLAISSPSRLRHFLMSLSLNLERSEYFVTKLSEQNVLRWIRMHSGANQSTFDIQTETIEKFLISVFRSSSNFRISRSKLLGIRLLLSHRFGSHSLTFDQVFRFYLQELSEHAIHKYHLLSSWISNGIKRHKAELKGWLSPEVLVLVEKEVRDLREPDQIFSKAEEEAERVSKLTAELTDLTVPNSGLVLFWPFYKRLFSRLGYLSEEGTFLSNVERSRAVRLLHHLSGFSWNEPEYNMSLNKILCGMPFGTTMERNLEITVEEESISSELLVAVISNWEQLGNTSVEGLQDSFLQRPGVLYKEENNWNMRVEKSGIDVLIDFIPWTFNPVAMSWMSGAIYVEWR